MGLYFTGAKQKKSSKVNTMLTLPQCKLVGERKSMLYVQWVTLVGGGPTESQSSSVNDAMH